MEKGKSLLKKTVYLEKGNISQNTVPSVPSTAEPKPDYRVVFVKKVTYRLSHSLPDGTIVYHAVYDNGSNEAFMIHVQEIMNFCKRKGLYKSYEKTKTNFACWRRL